MTVLGRLEQVPLREVWRHEASDFTQWLALPENIDQLAEVILGGGSLTVTDTEVNVGSYKADILAVDSEDRVVVIENQLEQTDHDHLGKILTYGAGKQAEVLVWIVKDAREEHENAVNWLNEHTDDMIHLFLIQIEAWRIGSSAAAPRFNIIAKPNDWLKAVKQSTASGSVSDLKLQQQAFFEEVRELGNESAPHVKSWARPQPQHWYEVRVGSGKGQILITVNSQKSYVGVEFYVNAKDTYYDLEHHKPEIEEAVGVALDWQELPTKAASRIQITRAGDFRDGEIRAALREWAVQTTDSFARVFPRFL
ncbi:MULTISPECIES: DUF4268 domain-containing protein [Gordonia]|uniref:DUF4268 domain-containing protein n=1 Tax=Gordonia alkanivorans NBRC 16433 TaxID=1027371 RepID=F9VQC3_9ACTN|nr:MULTISPECIES: DUF4268 domain-containing protein [Gordonia]WJG11625.1 DUF4268 domain-containing protein [Gordonia sp. Swx-4]GAA10812.1 hypothetical protein GOALK_014_00350 [Gordonia alkanivorans NBRC 16433]